MNRTSMPEKLRNCPSCGQEGSLNYYHEYCINDYYWCGKCFKVSIWDGEKVEKTDIEAYPNRDKEVDSEHHEGDDQKMEEEKDRENEERERGENEANMNQEQEE